MNILFYYASPVEHSNRLFLGTANLYLKTYIDQNNPILATKLNWLMPQQRELSDDALIKLASIAQKLVTANTKSEGEVGFLTDAEKEQLLKEIDVVVNEVRDEQDSKVDNLTNEVEELKQKIGK